MLIHAMIPVAAFITTIDLGPPAGPPAVQAGSWLPWHGCWEVVADDDSAGHLLCVLPGADAAEVRLVAVAGTVTEEVGRVRADGAARRIDEGGCAGTEQANWSRDGRRVFLRTVLDCDGLRRVTTGAMAMVSQHEWVDVQAAAVAGQQSARTLRYRAVPASHAPAAVRDLIDDTRLTARQTARLNAAAPLGIDEVIEATSHLATPALQALLTARGDRLALSGRELLRLGEAGVAPEVIDVLVALAYPQRFAIRQPAAVEPDADRQRWYGVQECYDPFTRRVLYGSACDWLHYGSTRRGYGYGYGGPYSSWGYGRGYYHTPTVVIVEPREPQRRGEMVRGSGYTRGTNDSGSTRGTAQPRSTAAGSSGSAGGTSAGSTTTRTAQPASTTTSGSGSSSGTSTGRTAKPRTGGGGDGGGQP